MKIRLMKAAIRDLRETRAYIATDDSRAAQKVMFRLEKAIALIGEQPQIGRPIPEQSAREWSVPGLPYVIAYRVLDGVIEIVRIHHTSRKRPSEW
jgi:plasmid stabilization system protein ParE